MKILTALPVRVAHLEVTAGSGRVLAGAIRAADLLNLLAETLQGAVHLQITVTENVSVISAVHAEGIRCLLLRLGDEAKVESTTRSSRCSRRTRRSRRSLQEEDKEEGKKNKRRSWLIRNCLQVCGALKNPCSLS